jgi:hypothetical protein
VQCEVGLIQSRSVKKVASCISNNAKRRRSEGGRIEPEIIGGRSRIVIDLCGS